MDFDDLGTSVFAKKMAQEFDSLARDVQGNDLYFGKIVHLLQDLFGPFSRHVSTIHGQFVGHLHFNFKWEST